jgi:hypothetical protein
MQAHAVPKREALRPLVPRTKHQTRRNRPVRDAPFGQTTSWATFRRMTWLLAVGVCGMSAIALLPGCSGSGGTPGTPGAGAGGSAASGAGAAGGARAAGGAHAAGGADSGASGAGSPACFDEDCGKPEPPCDPGQCPERSTCTVLAGVAICEPWVCTPGALECDATGKQILRCAEDGLSFESEEDCTANGGGRCHLAECVPPVCNPGSLFCIGSEVHACSTDGTESSVLTTCGDGERCLDGMGMCTTQVCTPGSNRCDDEVASECAANGSGYENAVDCAADGQKCYAGSCKPVLCDGAYCQDGNAWACLDAGTRTELVDECSTQEQCADGVCVPIVCTPGAYFCSEGNPQLCNGSGTAATQNDVCEAAEHCKAGSPTCEADVCQAGAKLCEGLVATTCAADGSGPLMPGTDCSSTDEVCSAGDCVVSANCTPNQYFCEAGNVRRCATDGHSSTLTEACADGKFCKPGVAYCMNDVCTPGAVLCNGDNITTCAADGSGPANAGASCGSGQICESNACKAVICTIDALTCTSNDLYRCASKGTAWAMEEDCPSTLYCNGARSPAACEPLFCAPDAATCNGEKLATCAADGWHYATTGTDCSTTNQVCTLAGTCVGSAVDTVGDASEDGAVMNTYLVANAYHVDRPRTLTQIEQYLTVAGTPTLTWVVYEGFRTTDPQPYPYIFDRKLAEVATTHTGGTALHSSDAISVQLEAGKYYLIGVIVPGPATLFWQREAGASFVSFGEQLDSLSESGARAQPSYTIFVTSPFRYYQRLTTTAAQ